MVFQPDATVLMIAFLLDLLLKDPVSFPHPVRWMGKAVAALEPVFRKLVPSPVIAGGLFCLTLVSAAWTIGTLTMWMGRQVHPTVGSILECVLLWYCIAAGSLADAAEGVVRELMQRGVAFGRKAVSMIVGRDTRFLDERGVLRAALETTAENFVDGVFAPLFYYAVGGVSLALTYKMINTLDSMVGYRNERYIYFGKAAARLDDLANWIPARLAVPLIACSAMLLGHRGKDAWVTAFREGKDHLSPNSGYPEAAFAGALHVRLNGPNVYHGHWVPKPYIGKSLGEVTPRHVFRAVDLMLAASFLSVCLLSFLLWIGLRVS